MNSFNKCHCHPRHRFKILQRCLEKEPSAKCLEARHHSYTEDRKRPETSYIIPADPANINAKQTDGEARNKSSDAVLGEV